MRYAIAVLGCLALLTPDVASAQSTANQDGDSSACYNSSAAANSNVNYNTHSCYDTGRSGNAGYYPSNYPYVVINPTEMTNTRDNRGDIAGGGNSINPVVNPAHRMQDN